MGSCCGKDKDNLNASSSCLSETKDSHPLQSLQSLETLRKQIMINLINHPTQKDYTRLRLMERLMIFYKDDLNEGLE